MKKEPVTKLFNPYYFFSQHREVRQDFNILDIISTIWRIW